MFRGLTLAKQLLLSHQTQTNMVCDGLDSIEDTTLY